MPTNTYVALDKVTVGTATSSVSFTSINQGYTDLVLVVSGQMTGGGGASAVLLQFNGDTSSNYSVTLMTGDGSSATSSRVSNQSSLNLGLGTDASGQVATNIMQIMNYSNATTYKTVLSRAGIAGDRTRAYVGLWRATPAAITSIAITNNGATNFAAGSTFSLYGIAASGVSPAAKATGGAIYADDTYYYHVFGSTGTFTPLSSLTADVLVVAGGGGGGRIVAGGGGAGGLTYYASQSLTATGYTCTVGGGGAGSTTAGYTSGAQGGNSSFTGLTASVGGGGGGAINANGGNGGSGGGAGGTGTSQTGGTATSGQGNAGASITSTRYEGAGGGGAGAAGTTSDATGNGDGGIGVSTYSSWGIATGIGENVSGTYYIAGGGGGGASTAGATVANAGTGGSGGGGRGGFTNSTTNVDNAAVAGLANTGGGGGGAGNDITGNNDNTYGKNGGSGVVIVRYLKA
jgi:hypothetical protein